jgi:hypothetical protein
MQHSFFYFIILLYESASDLCTPDAVEGIEKNEMFADLIGFFYKTN